MSIEGLNSEVTETSQPQLLFVDDDERALKLLRKIFKDTNYTCFFAQSGFAALAILENEAIDVLVSDMRMPNMAGNELLEIAKRKYPDIIRFAVSGSFDIADTIDAINRGSVTNYVIKPFCSKELKLNIYKALAAREKQNQSLKRLKESQKCAAERARQAGRSAVQLKAMMDEVLVGFLAVIDKLHEDYELSEDRLLFRKELSHELAEAVPLDEKEKVQLDTALFLTALSSKQCEEAISALPKTAFLTQAIALMCESYRSENEVKVTPFLDQSYMAIEELDRCVNLQGKNWQESIADFNRSHADYSTEVLLAVNSINERCKATAEGLGW